jgi:hypothetical protein
MVRAFIFSLDAFVAFSLILVVIHALVFLSAIPSSYYGALMQANYLAHDSLSSLAQENAYLAPGLDFVGQNMTMIDYIVRYGADDPPMVRARVGVAIPEEYGYRISVYASDGSERKIYDVRDWDSSVENHSKVYNKLAVSAYSLYFGYLEDPSGVENNHCYITCKSGGACMDLCKAPNLRYDPGKVELGLVKLTVFR